MQATTKQQHNNNKLCKLHQQNTNLYLKSFWAYGDKTNLDRD